MNIRTFQCNMLQENCYVVSDDESGQVVVIDCGAWYDAERKAITNYLRSNALTLRHVLCTHGHMDHIFGVDTLYQEFGIAPRLHAADHKLYYDMEGQTATMLGIAFNRPMPPFDQALTDGEVVTFGNSKLLVMHTPGHSPGSVVFYCPDQHLLFSGDTLFRMGVGRTDLQGGSWQQLAHSLTHVLSTLPPETVVCCGHGPNTTIGQELRSNPYLSY